MMRRYLADIRRFGGGRLVWIVVLTLAGAATDGIGILLLVPLLDLLGAGSGRASTLSTTIRDALDAIGIPFTVGWVLVVYVVLIAVRAVITRLRDLAMVRFRLEFVDWQRMRLFEAVARADWLFHVRRRSSDLMHTLMADIGRIGQGTTLVLQATSRTVMTVTYLLVAIRLSPPMAGLAVLMSVALSALLWPLVRRSRQMGELQTTQGKRSFGSITQFLGGIKLAKSHGTEQDHVDEFGRTISDLRAAQFDFQRVQATATVAYQVASAGGLAVLVWLGVEVLEVGTSRLIALVVVFARILPVAGTISGDVRNAANMLPAYRETSEVLDQATAVAERASTGGEARVPIEQGIELDGVSFRYPEGGGPALEGVSLHVPANTTTALVGPSGAGKTTLADLVLGLLTPDRGEVRVDGRRLDRLDLAAWRSTIAYVPQDPFLFHDTLRVNVAWATDGLSDDEIGDLLSLASLGDLVGALPEGLDTVVGDRGHRLSGGERQRVVLARALARRPSLLVLDEATSSLDRGHEQAVQAAIDGLHGELTVLVIAHRLSTVRHADQIVVLDHGRLCEQGIWDDLMGRDGRFAALVDRADLGS